METFSMKCFLMLAEQLNFTKVAYVMNVSQPTLSRIIAALETEVGVALFHRSKQSIKLTNAGKEFTVYVEKILSDYDDAIRRAQIVDGANGGRICVGFLPAMCMNILPAVVRRMKREHPEVELVLEPHGQEELILEIKKENLDIVLFLPPRTDSLIQCDVEIFFRDEYNVFLHREHKLANREFISLEDIYNERCYFYKAICDYRARGSHLGLLAIQYDLMKTARLNNVKEVNDLLGLITMLECNEGIGILPTHVQRLALPNIKFVKLLTDENNENTSFRGAICWRRSSDSPAMRNFRKIVREIGGYQ